MQAASVSANLPKARLNGRLTVAGALLPAVDRLQMAATSM
jgi:hypothetical protein